MSQCLLCRKIRATSCIQKMADLPRERIGRGHSTFSHVGLDYFGPFEMRVRRSTEKRNGCIFIVVCQVALFISICLRLSMLVHLLTHYVGLLPGVVLAQNAN